MNTLTVFFFTLLLTAGLLASCAQPNPHPMDMTAAVTSAKDKADHQALADHYEAAAQDMRAKMDEHEQLLSRYKEAPWLYGRQSQSFQTHCAKLVRIYGQAVEENMEMARMHREMAASAR